MPHATCHIPQPESLDFTFFRCVFLQIFIFDLLRMLFFSAIIGLLVIVVSAVASFGDYKVFLCYKVEDDIDDTWLTPTRPGRLTRQTQTQTA